jgi:hypothetical protein
MADAPEPGWPLDCFGSFPSIVQGAAMPDDFARLTGTPLDSTRLQEVLAAFAPILEEIARLRELDLGDVHPAVIFEPTAAYRRPR